MVNKGIMFNDTHSYYDLNLILSESEIPPAEPKTTYVDVPGADGSVDLTEAHGEVKYKDRDCTFTFAMLPGDNTTWEEKKTEVSNFLNGKVFKLTQDKDEDFYYYGRCTVDNYLSDRNLKQIVVTARVKPYKYKQYETAVTIQLAQTAKTVNLMNGRKSVSPTIRCSDDNTVITFGTATFNVNAGTHKILDIQLIEGNNAVTVSGTGTVVFSYQEGEL